MTRPVCGLVIVAKVSQMLGNLGYKSVFELRICGTEYRNIYAFETLLDQSI